MRKAWLPVLVGLVGAALTSCGSTVQQTQQVSQPDGSGLEAPAGSTGGGGTSGGLAPTVPSSSQGGSAPDGTALPGGRSSLGGTTGASGTTGGVAGPRAITTPIEIGVGVSTNAASAYKAIGFNIDFGDGRQQAMAVINDINGRGGLDGRKIVPVWGENDAGDTSGIAAKEQRMCSVYTEDHKVVAVAGALGATTTTLLPCLNRRGVAYTANGGGTFYDQAVFEEFPLLLSPGMLNFSRFMPFMVERLVARGFFTKWQAFAQVKIGVIGIDALPNKRVWERDLKPALARHGLQAASVVFVEGADGSREISEIQNAVLKFQSEGVSHVMFVENGGGVPVFFTQVAERQAYHPRYALGSANSPGVLLQPTTPPAQLVGAMGIGWNPMQDVDEAHDFVSATNPAWVRCKKVMSDAGVNMTVRLTAYAAGQYCDTIYVLAGTLNRASGWTGRGLVAQAATLGNKFQAALTLVGTHLSAKRRDGVSTVRDLTFVSSCSCFQYGRSTWRVP